MTSNLVGTDWRPPPASASFIRRSTVRLDRVHATRRRRGPFRQSQKQPRAQFPRRFASQKLYRRPPERNDGRHGLISRPWGLAPSDTAAPIATARAAGPKEGARRAGRGASLLISASGQRRRPY